MTNKEELKRLIDELPDEATEMAKSLLVSLLLGQSALAHAAIDDEPTTGDDVAAVREGREEFARRETISSGEARHRLLG
ncbi:MAG TPA: hypothetical protein V6D47_02665 [Oscillatoriaceae cyanobacterium]